MLYFELTATHTSSRIRYKRQQTSMPPSEHAVRKQEIDRALQTADWRVVSYAHWSKGDRATAGVIRQQQAGAGCGGCLLVQRPHVDEFAAHMTRAYQAATNIEPRRFILKSGVNS